MESENQRLKERIKKFTEDDVHVEQYHHPQPIPTSSFPSQAPPSIPTPAIKASDSIISLIEPLIFFIFYSLYLHFLF